MNKPEETVEGRGVAKGNPEQQNRSRAQHRQDLQSALERVRQVAKKDKEVQFTTLWHHVYDIDRLRESYLSLKRESAPGVDKVTWREYSEGLEARLEDLAARLKRGAYKARPVKRTYIEKADGKQRPIGIPTLEDKIVQRATVEVLNAVYEVDFAGFSYGFRPKRSTHTALDALTVGITRKKVSWVLDADIRGFFDAIDHEWLIRFVEHRIADKRVLRHIKKWLNAGVMEKGQRTKSTVGTPQGGSISPLLANIYLHYAFDLWIDQWRKRHATGDVIVVRYADDFVVGFERREDAEKLRAALETRLRKFNLELHPEKTRLIEFGRFANERRKRRGDGKPETFDFLGFTHLCGKTRSGKFVVKRRTQRSRLQRKLQQLKVELARRWHNSIEHTGKWLGAVLKGHYQYYGVPFNYDSLARMRDHVITQWYRRLRKRSQRTRLTWDRMVRYADRWLPKPAIHHPYPTARFDRRHPRQEPSAVIPHAGICAGGLG